MNYNLSKLFIVAFLVASSLSCRARQLVEGHRLEEQQYTLTVPRTWTIEKDSLNPDCKLLKSPKATKEQNFSVRLCVVVGSPTLIASERGFYRDGEDWIYTGSMDTRPAKLSEGGGGMMRLTGKASCGITNSTGFHAPGGECYTTVVFGQNYSVVFETDGTFKDYSTIQKILGSTTLVAPGDHRVVKEMLGLSEN